MNNRLSHSAVKTYSECSRKYFLQYRKRFRSKVISGALLYGSAIDGGLNTLLLTKDLQKAKDEFNKIWSAQYINNVYTALPFSTIIVYADTDFDKDLVTKNDIEKFKETTSEDIEEAIIRLKTLKKENGFNSLSEKDKKTLNYAHWLSLKSKGHIMLESYNKKILPKIKEVLAVQKAFSIEGSTGDAITGYIDLVVEFHDGTRYVLDNKTSTREYKSDEAGRSQQLIIYYHSEKEQYSLDGVGFVVLSKSILKNKTKICSLCGNDGSGKTHGTCDAKNGAPNKKGELSRCSAPWNITIDPECYIDVILSKVTPQAENLVLEAFDEANQSIHKEIFNPNLSGCVSGPIICPYYKYCWEGKEDDIITLDKKD